LSPGLNTTKGMFLAKSTRRRKRGGILWGGGKTCLRRGQTFTVKKEGGINGKGESTVFRKKNSPSGTGKKSQKWENLRLFNGKKVRGKKTACFRKRRGAEMTGEKWAFQEKGVTTRAALEGRRERDVGPKRVSPVFVYRKEKRFLPEGLKRKKGGHYRGGKRVPRSQPGGEH